MRLVVQASLVLCRIRCACRWTLRKTTTLSLSISFIESVECCSPSERGKNKSMRQRLNSRLKALEKVLPDETKPRADRAASACTKPGPTSQLLRPE